MLCRVSTVIDDHKNNQGGCMKKTYIKPVVLKRDNLASVAAGCVASGCAV